METDLCKMPLQMASETANQMIESRLHCDRHEYELLGSSEDTKFGYRKPVRGVNESQHASFLSSPQEK